MTNLHVALKEEMLERVPWLLEELGFRIVDERYDPQSFGNSLVTLESDSLRVRFVRDRGQVFADVASPSDPDRWWQLVYVCQLILGEFVQPGFELDDVAAFLRDNLAAVQERLGPRYSETKREVRRLQEERARRLLGPYSGGSWQNPHRTRNDS